MRYIIKNYVYDALHSIWSNKLRSFLSILGIVIGIVSVIVFLGIGKGAELEMQKYIDKYSSKSLNIYPSYNEFGDKKNVGVVIDDNLIAYLEDRIHNVKAILPELRSGKFISYGVSAPENASIIGISPKYLKIFDDKKIAYGRFFTPLEYAEKEKVVVINDKIARTFFPQGDALGKYLKIGSDLFKVVGVLEQTDTEKQNFRYASSEVFIPQGVLTELFSGKTDYDNVTVYAEDDANMQVLHYELLYLLMRKTNVKNKSELAFEVYDASKFQKEQEDFATKSKLILMGIGCISLLVGGIGVMNIMLVSVTERTREIGIRKAIGARKYHIIGQFLTESIFISILGAIFALLLSYLIISLLKKFEIPAVLTGDVMLLACMFAIAVGVIFGLLPAVKAARLKPIDALRFE